MIAQEKDEPNVVGKAERMANKMADQLREAEARITELEAALRALRDAAHHDLAKTGEALDNARKEVDALRAALRAAFTAMGVASCIDAVRAEYDFEPAMLVVREALEKD